MGNINKSKHKQKLERSIDITNKQTADKLPKQPQWLEQGLKGKTIINTI
jgi:hypothetical protein